MRATWSRNASGIVLLSNEERSTKVDAIGKVINPIAHEQFVSSVIAVAREFDSKANRAREKKKDETE